MQKRSFIQRVLKSRKKKGPDLKEKGRKNSLIFGVETSCDESSIALFDTAHGATIFEETHTQSFAHAVYGGVVPDIASRLHLDLLSQMLQNLEAKVPYWQARIQCVAATTRPGLITSLLVGGVFGKSLAHFLCVPFIPIDHCEAHMYSCLLDERGSTTYLDFSKIKDLLPASALILSGGHSFWIWLDRQHKTTCLGATRDDALGECFDKVARILGLGYPGGPEIELLAKRGDPHKISLPLAMPAGLDFSFSGLKTAVKRSFESQSEDVQQEQRSNFASSFQKIIEKVIAKKVKSCIDQTKPKSIWFAGGVSANQAIRKVVRTVCAQNHTICHIVPRKYSGDNASMIAYLAHLKYKRRSEIKKEDAKIVPHSVFSGYPQ